METNTVGKVIVSAKIENLFDTLWKGAIAPSKSRSSLMNARP